MSVSKAYLRRLYWVVQDRERLAAIRKFLMKYGDEINTNNLVITADGEMFYEGTIGKITFYKKWGKYHRKKKSSLTGKRFRKDKAFKGSRESAERFAAGNKLASRLYATVDAEKKVYSLFCFLKKRAIGLLKEGMSENAVRAVLVDYLRSFETVAQEETQSVKKELTKTNCQVNFPIHTASTETIAQKEFMITSARVVAPSLSNYMIAGP